LLKPDANETAAGFVKDMIRQTVKDPEVAELLCPTNIIGCKRLCVDTNYYATYNLPHVKLVDVSKTPIEEITPDGLSHNDLGYEFDAIVLATGFDAMTGALFNIDIQGKGGESLKEKWNGGPQTYLGLTTVGFPNMFTITGPGSPSVLFPKRLGDADELASMVMELLTNDYMNGEVVRADGGVRLPPK
ncbi:MAG: cyclohexanone monooxygenase, partial [Proteobacteria bacterium]|nr:cyclohexanone monooxygenase [Pseudomonadota bacterium]